VMRLPQEPRGRRPRDQRFQLILAYHAWMQELSWIRLQTFWKAEKCHLQGVAEQGLALCRRPSAVNEVRNPILDRADPGVLG